MNVDKSRLPLLACLLAAVAATAPAAATDAEPAAQRPRIGLVLAGGGAKGGAHVGALKVLEELHVPWARRAKPARDWYSASLVIDRLEALLPERGLAQTTVATVNFRTIASS